MAHLRCLLSPYSTVLPRLSNAFAANVLRYLRAVGGFNVQTICQLNPPAPPLGWDVSLDPRLNAYGCHLLTHVIPCKRPGPCPLCDITANHLPTRPSLFLAVSIEICPWKSVLLPTLKVPQAGSAARICLRHSHLSRDNQFQMQSALFVPSSLLWIYSTPCCADLSVIKWLKERIWRRLQKKRPFLPPRNSFIFPLIMACAFWIAMLDYFDKSIIK